MEFWCRGVLRAVKAGGLQSQGGHQQSWWGAEGWESWGETGGFREAQTKLLWKNALLVCSALPFCGAVNPPIP